VIEFQRADWMVHANCRGIDTDFFHPRRGQATDHIKAVCKDCPVLDACRKMALEDHTLRGVWGGLSEAQRRDYRQGRTRRAVTLKPPTPLKAINHGTHAGYQQHRRQGTMCDECRQARNEHRAAIRAVKGWRAA